MESCVPPGFRFHPTDEELVGYYLRKKVASQKIDLDVIPEIDLYRIEPWDLQERCRMGYEEEKEWYFFSHKDKKYPTGTRTNRATMAGFWKATGRDKAVYDKSSKLIGMRKTLVFYKGRAPHGHKSDWIMHEYRLQSDDDNNNNAPLQEEGWVVCRAFKKRSNGQTKIIEGSSSWESSYLYEEAIISSGVVDPIDLISRKPHQKFLAQNLMCKEEMLIEHATAAEQFVQLPQLESPSLPLAKRPRIVSDQINNTTKKVITTDWRTLDKFVASQLMSHHEADEGLISSFQAQHTSSSSSSNMALLPLQNSYRDEERNMLSPSLSTGLI